MTAGIYATEQAAIDSLTSVGYTDHGNGFYGKVGMTQGSYSDAPYKRLSLAKVVHNRVAPEYNLPDYYTVSFD